MAQDRRGHRLDVAGGDEVPAAQEGAGPAAAVQRDRGARAGAVAHQAGHLAVVFFRRARGPHQFDDIAFEAPGQVQFEHPPPVLHDLFDRVAVVGIASAGRGFGCLPARKFQYSPLLLGARIADPGLHQEAVELRLGERVGALLLDGVLRGHDQERLRQRPALLRHGDLPLLHRFQQGGLHLGRGAVDLVGQQQVVEDRTGAKLELARLRPEDVGAGQVRRQQVGRELHPVKAGLEAAAEHLHRPGLGQSRHALHQQMPPREQRNEHVLDELLLAEDARLHSPAHGGQRQLRDLARRGFGRCHLNLVGDKACAPNCKGDYIFN